MKIKIQSFEEIDSTNEEAKRQAAAGAPEGTVILAKSQKKGKGKLGRVWHSDLGGIYLSIILKPRLNLPDLSELTLLSAEAVAQTIKILTNLEAKVKWPNDVLLNGKKVCGILTEVAKKTVIVGIGLNVNNSHLPEEATSIKRELGWKVDIAKAVEILLSELERVYQAWYIKRSNESTGN